MNCKINDDIRDCDREGWCSHCDERSESPQTPGCTAVAKLTSRPPKIAEKTPDLLRSGVVPGCTDGMTVLDLFSGIGGFSLGLERAGMRTIAFCEIEEFPRRVLRKHWPNVPIFEDVRKLHAADLPERPTVIVGGFPCQPFSVSGKKQGKLDDRYLWDEMLRVIAECRPTWVVGENVSGAITILREIKDGLAAIGFESAIFDIPTSALGFPHHRRRMWIVAHANGNRLEALTERRRKVEGLCNEASGASTAFSAAKRLHGRRDCKAIRRGDGISRGLVKPRLKAIGNAVCPAIPEIIGRAITECG